jgi:hypothetical protein
LKNQLDFCSNVRQIEFDYKEIIISLLLNESPDKVLKLFKPDFDENLLINIFDDIELAYDQVLPISREKFLDVMKIIEFIPNTANTEFYKCLYSLDSAPMSRNQKLIHDLFQKNNKNIKKTKSLKKIKV